MGELRIVETNTLNALRNHMKENNISTSMVAKAVGKDRSTISKYLNGNYNSNVDELERDIEDYLATEYSKSNAGKNAGKNEHTATITNTKVDMVLTNDAVGIMGVCDSCQNEGAMGIVVAKSGYGKTYTLKKYLEGNRKVVYICCGSFMSSKDLIRDIEKALGIPTSYKTIHERVQMVADFLEFNPGYLIIVDEADKLLSKYTRSKLDILRDIHDKSSVGIVVAGEPKLESDMKNFMERYTNRIDFYYKLKGLQPKEVEEFVQGFDVTEEAQKELVERGSVSKEACFRLLDRTVNNIIRVIKDSGDNTVNKIVVNKASAMMMR